MACGNESLSKGVAYADTRGMGSLVFVCVWYGI